MENLQRDLEKKLAEYSLPVPSKKSIKWYLYFIADNGKIIRIRKFKVLSIVLSCLFFTSIIAALLLGFLYTVNIKKNKKIQYELVKSKEQSRLLRNENDLLMARLVVTEGNNEKQGKVPDKLEQKDKDTSMSKKTVSLQESIPVQEVIEDEEIDQSLKDNTTETQEEDNNINSSDAKDDMAVSVSEYKLSIAKDSSSLMFQFIIKNISQSSTTISGRIFVILKPEKGYSDDWIISPPSPIVLKKPSDYKAGQFFAISRFKTVRLRFRNNSEIDKFKKGTVFVYTKKGNLILEQDFVL